MTSAEALADRRVIYRLAAVADVDPRTVESALRGQPGKGSSHRRVMDAIVAAGISLGGDSPRSALKSM